MPFSRSAVTAWSSAAAERGISQRPKARNEARSSGAPLSGGSEPDQLRLAVVVDVPDDDALVAQVEQRIGALHRGIEVGDLAAQLDILAGRLGALADEEDGRQQGGAHDAGKHRQLHHLEGAERIGGTGELDVLRAGEADAEQRGCRRGAKQTLRRAQCEAT